MSAIQQIMSSYGAASDPYWSSVVWLSHFDSSIVDESPLARPLTVVGATTSTAQKKFGAASALFNTTVKEVQIASEISFAGDFTVEMWVYPLDTADRIIVSGFTGNCQLFRINYGSTGRVYSYLNNAEVNQGSAGACPINTWTHLALSRQSGTARLFANGVLQGSVSAPTVQLYTVGTFRYGGSTITTDVFDGYIDEFRVTDGVARYTANFSVPTAAFPNS